jgi:hypothetical protein
MQILLRFLNIYEYIDVDFRITVDRRVKTVIE